MELRSDFQHGSQGAAVRAADPLFREPFVEASMSSLSRRPAGRHLVSLLVSSLILVTTAVASVEWEQTAPRPPARAGHALAYDGARGRVVLFGGNVSIGYLGDTWEWNGTAWTNVTPATGSPARSGHALAYDGSRGRMVLFGGRDDSIPADRADT